MKQPKYGWETSFDTAKNLMHHTFTDRVRVQSNIKNGEILVLFDGNIINAYYNMPVKQYEALLLGVEEYAYQLQRKQQLKMLACKAAVWVLVMVALLALMLLGGDNDQWTTGEFLTQKACCFAVMGGCYLSVKHTTALATAWQAINTPKHGK